MQDLLPTLLTAVDIEVDNAKFDGRDKWKNLITNEITPPINALVGARVISDERALFDGEWKLHSAKPQLIPVSPSYSLFNLSLIHI